MLVHSHVPGLISLLPALPREYGVKGSVVEMRLRGDVTLSMQWREGKVISVDLLFHTAHPWCEGRSVLVLQSPNQLRLSANNAAACGFKVVSDKSKSAAQDPWGEEVMGRKQSSPQQRHHHRVAVYVAPLWKHLTFQREAGGGERGGRGNHRCLGFRLCDAATGCN